MTNINLVTKSALMSSSRVVEPLWWVGHIPFVIWLVENIKPLTLVELGTHTGNSYFAMCQSVKSNKLTTRCYAVDTWHGDLHQGSYENDVYRAVKKYNDNHYSEFSDLLRMTFDEALPQFGEGTVDLLHIDGLHTYEAARHDFETWLPKLSDRAVVLFHDTSVRKLDFGVWRLWEELSIKYPNIHFDYSQGLGVLFVGERQPLVIHDVLNSWATSEGRSIVHQLFAKLGQSVEFEYVTANPDQAIKKRDIHIESLYQLLTMRDGQIASLSQAVIERDGQIASLSQAVTERDGQIASLSQAVTERDGQIASLSQAVTERDGQIANQQQERVLQGLIVELRTEINTYRSSTSWRITKPLREVSILRHRLVRLMRLGQNYHKKYPGVNGFLRLSNKCIEAIREGGLQGLRMRINFHERIRATTSSLQFSSVNNVVMLKDAVAPVIRFSSDLAVHAHVFYPDLVSELCIYLENIPSKFHLYVTTDTSEKANLIEAAFSNIANVSMLDVRIVANRGRDLAPMIVTLGAELARHEIVLHVHTKRSPHNTVLKGWRRYLLESLLGTPQRVAAILQQFSQSPNLGIFFPQAFNPVRPCMNIGGNRDNMEKLLALGGKGKWAIESVLKDYFPAGSMFWFRGKAIEAFVNMQLSQQDFEAEDGQSDSTLAHAIERMFVYFADDVGLQSQAYSTYQFDPDSGVSGFDWFRVYISNGLIQHPIIIFDHDYGGGTNAYSSILANDNTAGGASVLRCTFKDKFWLVEWIKADDGMKFATSSIEELFDTFAQTSSERIIVNSLYGYQEILKVSERIITLAQTLGAPLDYQAHDFHGICPSPHLLDFTNTYCAVPQDHVVCSKCLKKNQAWYIKESWADNIDDWRHPFARLIESATSINFFDSTAIDIYRKVFHIEDCKINITAHSDTYFECNEKLDLSGSLHIGVLGTLTIVKGGAVVNALCNYIGKQGIEIPITVVGASLLPTDQRIKILGSYKVNELPDIVRGNHINVIFMSSIVPETFSYTVSEAMKMGLPIVAFDLGAQGNRVKKYDLGKVIPLGASPEVILAAIQSVLKTTQELNK